MGLKQVDARPLPFNFLTSGTAPVGSSSKELYKLTTFKIQSSPKSWEERETLSRGRQRSHVRAAAMFVVKLSSDVTRGDLWRVGRVRGAAVTTCGETPQLQSTVSSLPLLRDLPHFIILL